MELSREKRGKLFGIVVAFLGFVLVLRFGFLQIVSYRHYRDIAEENRLRLVFVPAPRGVIYDRAGRTLVNNRVTYTVSLIPYEIKDIYQVAQRLAPLLDIDQETFMAKVKRRSNNPYEPIRLKRDVDFATICQLEEQNENFPGVIYQIEQIRNYPTDSLGSHFTGYVSEVSEAEIEKSKKRLRRGAMIGKQGLENSYNDLVRGIDGAIFLEVTAQGKVLGPLSDRPPQATVTGSDLYLTIDQELQTAAEQALTGFCCGAVVAVDPRNGEVLTFVSKPGYNANAFAVGLSSEMWEALVNDSTYPLLNRSIQALYPPGSTTKILTAAAALELRLITKDKRFAPCSGALWFGNRLFRCWKPEGHGSLDLMGAIVQSCDVYFYQLGLVLGLERWSQTARECGFGAKTGIDVPDEWSGLVPSTSYYAKRYGRNRWPKGVMLNLSIGQGEFLVTPLQLACFFAALGNQGLMYKPHLLKKSVSPDGKISESGSILLRRLPFSEPVLSILKEGLIGVVNNSFGTALTARLPDVVVAGKTGTAQNPHGREHAWFACFAPAKDPEIAIAVLVENAGHGGSVAAPIARKILETYFQKDTLPRVPARLATAPHRQ